MKIIEIKITNFGKLSGFSLKPNDGVNIIFGDNESGKSTLMAFVKSMFYGLGNGEKRRQYEPWKGGQMGGSIEFEHEGREYILNRTFGQTKAGDRISLFDKSAGEEVSLPADKELGAFILGMNVKSFVNTVFVGQSGASIEGENPEILARLTNMASAGDERISKSEVEKNLKKGVVMLESKRSTAILPELRKQKHELVEARAEIQASIQDSDELREAIIMDRQRQNSLTREKRYLADIAQKLSKQADLRDIDMLMIKHDELEALRKDFGELDAVFSGDNSEQISEFLSEAKELIEAEKSQQIVIDNKLSQIEEIKKSVEGVDRSRLGHAKIINKYPQEISSAFERYDSLMAEKNDIEISMEQGEKQIPEKCDTKLLVVACLGIAALTILLGYMAHPLFYAVGMVVILSLIAYVFVYKKGMQVEGVTDEHIELNNVNEDLRALNSEMRSIFDLLGVKSMEELDREYKEIERIQNMVITAKNRRDGVEAEIAELTAELEDIRSKLKEKLAVYHETDSNEEAAALVSELDALNTRHQQLAAELKAAESAFEFMLKERDYDELVKYGEKLRNDTDIMDEIEVTEEAVAQRADDVSKQLDEISERLIRQETRLSLEKYSPQDIDAVTDDIKSINKRIDHYEEELEAVNTARAVLDEAYNEMQLDFGPMLNYRAGRILGGITGEKYTSVFVSDKLIPSVAEAGSSQIRSCGVLSTGTFDQIYLSLRLALSGVMSDEKLPVFLDDAFAQFDDERMERALDFINDDCKLNELGQVMLFTCHDRVLEAAERLGIAQPAHNMSELNGESADISKTELDFAAFEEKETEGSVE